MEDVMMEDFTQVKMVALTVVPHVLTRRYNVEGYDILTHPHAVTRRGDSLRHPYHCTAGGTGLNIHFILNVLFSTNKLKPEKT